MSCWMFSFFYVLLSLQTLKQVHHKTMIGRIIKASAYLGLDNSYFHAQRHPIIYC